MLAPSSVLAELLRPGAKLPQRADTLLSSVDQRGFSYLFIAHSGIAVSLDLFATLDVRPSFDKMRHRIPA